MRLEPVYPLPICNKNKKEKIRVNKPTKQIDWVNVFLVVLLLVIVIMYLFFI